MGLGRSIHDQCTSNNVRPYKHTHAQKINDTNRSDKNFIEPSLRYMMNSDYWQVHGRPIPCKIVQLRYLEPLKIIKSEHNLIMAANTSLYNKSKGHKYKMQITIPRRIKISEKIIVWKSIIILSKRQIRKN